MRYLQLHNCIFSHNFHETDVFKALFPSLKPLGAQVVDICMLLPTKNRVQALTREFSATTSWAGFSSCA